MSAVPSYLSGYADRYADDPRAAAIEWFRDAKYGLFLHFGLYSLVGRHEWLQLREKIYVAEYARLAGDFTAEGFDAERIADFALECEMKYINITTRHHDSFCLFETEETDFHAVNTPCGRDLIAELAGACADRGLGLCLYYSHGRDWRHPHAPNNDRWGGKARPDYDPPEPTYAYGDDHDLQIYVQFMRNQIDELLSNYGPIAAIWLDGIAVPLNGPAEEFHCQELYDFIHSKQPQVLVSYKQGLLGTEDFFAPEHKAVETGGKPGEICTTMTPGSWGYMREKAGEHLGEEHVREKIADARAANCNLLLNTGPLEDGSLDPEDVPVLRRVGERLRGEGFPGEE
ncbi:MAG: alpha-L-fucosidase [Armatimonadota bacterium]